MLTKQTNLYAELLTATEIIAAKNHLEKKKDAPTGILLAKFYNEDQAQKEAFKNDSISKIFQSESKSDPKVCQTFKTIFKNDQLQKIMAQSCDLQNQTISDSGEFSRKLCLDQMQVPEGEFLEGK